MKTRKLFFIGDRRGAVLIIAYMALFVLLTLSSSMVLLNFSELSSARRYQGSVAAFWLAESGLAVIEQNPKLLEDVQSMTLNDQYGHVEIKKEDIKGKARMVTATGTELGGVKRALQINFPPKAPEVFDSTVSAKGDLNIKGMKSMLTINDRLRLSGKVNNKTMFGQVSVEDVQAGLNFPEVALTYPDMDGDGNADQFADFVAFNRNLLKKYSQKEVIYIHGDGTYTLGPDENLAGKKIVYIEGNEGNGNVIIQFTGGWAASQNLTVIATGTVTLNQTGAAPHNSQLNIISWAGYNETAIVAGSRNGMTFTHGVAKFDGIYDTSVTNGGLVANGGIEVGEVWSTKTFNYADTRTKGVVPPGFEGLLGGGTTGYIDKPSAWKEI